VKIAGNSFEKGGKGYEQFGQVSGEQFSGFNVTGFGKAHIRGNDASG
jgi:hypothetical protein